MLRDVGQFCLIFPFAVVLIRQFMSDNLSEDYYTASGYVLLIGGVMVALGLALVWK